VSRRSNALTTHRRKGRQGLTALPADPGVSGSYAFVMMESGNVSLANASQAERDQRTRASAQRSRLCRRLKSSASAAAASRFAGIAVRRARTATL
jgi:hypothetical protein